VLSADSEIVKLIEYGIDCNLPKSMKDRSKVGGLIWLAESGCLDNDEECKVQKMLNKKRLLSLCGDTTTEECDKFIKCQLITIEVLDDSCDTTKTISIEVT
jgi:hypothetical protein